MTFTDADHAKAVELYEQFKDAEWWPKALYYRNKSMMWFVDGIPEAPDYALAAIGWAMVERFNSITLMHRENRGWSVYLYGDWKPTRFLALAAAVEGIDAAQ